MSNSCLWTYIRGLTALHASSEEVTEWINEDRLGNAGGDGQNRLSQSQQATSSGSNISQPSNLKPTGEKIKYTFICECFFMTARVLNLGLLKAFSDYKHLVQVIGCAYLFADKDYHTLITDVIYN